jgi:hypothetical protein
MIIVLWGWDTLLDNFVFYGQMMARLVRADYNNNTIAFQRK